MKYDIKCDCCGKFLKQENLGSYLFIPDSHVSYEEIYNRCKPCTEKHGKPISQQSFYPL